MERAKLIVKKAYQAFESWYEWLSVEKRLSSHTTDSYLLDLKPFLTYLQKKKKSVLWKRQNVTLKTVPTQRVILTVSMKLFLICLQMRRALPESVLRSMLKSIRSVPLKCVWI